MNLLLHICCGPCAIYPLRTLRTAGHTVTGFWYNHNIHPYQEYVRRLEAARQMAHLEGLELVERDEYDLEEFLRNTSAEPAQRCGYCYRSRLEAAAAMAAAGGFDGFTASLLYSRYQQHDLIRGTGEAMGKKYGVTFVYEDFRTGWQEGIRLSRELGLYRQQYCGCIYSEKDRYLPKGRNA